MFYISAVVNNNLKLTSTFTYSQYSLRYKGYMYYITIVILIMQDQVLVSANRSVE